MKKILIMLLFTVGAQAQSFNFNCAESVVEGSDYDVKIEKFQDFYWANRNRLTDLTKDLEVLQSTTADLLSDLDNAYNSVINRSVHVNEGREIMYEFQGKISNLSFFTYAYDKADWVERDGSYILVGNDAVFTDLTDKILAIVSDTKLELRPSAYGNGCFDTYHTFTRQDNGGAIIANHVNSNWTDCELETRGTGTVFNPSNFDDSPTLSDMLSTVTNVNYNDLYR